VERIETSGAGALDERPGGAGRRSGASRTVTWIALGVGLAAIGLAVYIGRNTLEQHPAPSPPVAAPSPAAPKPAPEASTVPAARYPIAGVESEGAKSESVPLPTLGGSDGLFRDLVTGLVGKHDLAALFYGDEMARRFVATVDNLPRRKLAVRLMPVKPASDSFQVVRDGGSILASPDNGKRYAAYVAVAEALDTRALVAAYVRVYPLLQEQYRMLGYPAGHFNDRVVEAIDDLLAAPDVRAPVALVQPKVRYEFADADLESRSAGQKIMMRMGAENEATMKAKLRELRSALAGSPPDRP
jgi:hypothetical protein